MPYCASAARGYYGANILSRRAPRLPRRGRLKTCVVNYSLAAILFIMYNILFKKEDSGAQAVVHVKDPYKILKIWISAMAGIILSTQFFLLNNQDFTAWFESIYRIVASTNTCYYSENQLFVQRSQYISTLGGIASICFRFHFQHTLRMHTQGCHGCQMTRNFVRNSKILIARSTVPSSQNWVKSKTIRKFMKIP